MDSPYSGGKILAGASAGEVIFYDPNGRLEEAQYKGCAVKPVDDKKWEEIVGRLLTSREDLRPRHRPGGKRAFSRSRWLAPAPPPGRFQVDSADGVPGRIPLISRKQSGSSLHFKSKAGVCIFHDVEAYALSFLRAAEIIER